MTELGVFGITVLGQIIYSESREKEKAKRTGKDLGYRRAFKSSLIPSREGDGSIVDGVCAHQERTTFRMMKLGVPRIW